MLASCQPRRLERAGPFDTSAVLAWDRSRLGPPVAASSRLCVLPLTQWPWPQVWGASWGTDTYVDRWRPHRRYSTSELCCLSPPLPLSSISSYSSPSLPLSPSLIAVSNTAAALTALSNYVVISFHGLCSKPNLFVNEGNVTSSDLESSDLECKKWEDLDECKDDFVFSTDSGTVPDEFFDKARGSDRLGATIVTLPRPSDDCHAPTASGAGLPNQLAQALAGLLHNRRLLCHPRSCLLRHRAPAG